MTRTPAKSVMSTSGSEYIGRVASPSATRPAFRLKLSIVFARHSTELSWTPNVLIAWVRIWCAVFAHASK